MVIRHFVRAGRGAAAAVAPSCSGRQTQAIGDVDGGDAAHNSVGQSVALALLPLLLRALPQIHPHVQLLWTISE